MKLTTTLLLLGFVALVFVLFGCVDSSQQAQTTGKANSQESVKTFHEENEKESEMEEMNEMEEMEEMDEMEGNMKMPSKMGEMMKISMEELSKHNSRDDCWMAIEGKVYDVTSFVSQHPGGEAILQGCGKDATQLYKTRPMGSGTPHSEDANEKLPQYYIGDLQQ